MKAGYYELPGRKIHSVNMKRSCVQDDLLNVAMCLGVNMLKQDVYKDLPPSDNNVSFQELIDSDSMKNNFSYKRVYFDNVKGGKELNLLKKVKSGVFLVMGTLSSIQGFVWQHAFIYDSDFSDDSTGCIGRIIDNDKYSGIRIVENEDRSTKKRLINF